MNNQHRETDSGKHGHLFSRGTKHNGESEWKKYIRSTYDWNACSLLSLAKKAWFGFYIVYFRTRWYITEKEYKTVHSRSMHESIRAIDGGRPQLHSFTRSMLDFLHFQHASCDTSSGTVFTLLQLSIYAQPHPTLCRNDAQKHPRKIYVFVIRYYWSRIVCLLKIVSFTIISRPLQFPTRPMTWYRLSPYTIFCCLQQTVHVSVIVNYYYITIKQITNS